MPGAVTTAVGAGFSSTTPELLVELELEELLLELVDDEELELVLEELLLDVLELELELLEELGLPGFGSDEPPPELHAPKLTLSNIAAQNLFGSFGIEFFKGTMVCKYFVYVLFMTRFP